MRPRSRSSAGLRWRRGRLWHPRRQHRPLRTGPGSGDRCEGRRFAPLARRIYVPGILSSEPSQVCPPAHGTVPERRANVQKGARPRGTDRRYSVPFRGSAGRRKDAGTCWLGCCPPELSTGETHPRAKRPMNRAKTSLRRRAAPPPRRVKRRDVDPQGAAARCPGRVLPTVAGLRSQQTLPFVPGQPTHVPRPRLPAAAWVTVQPPRPPAQDATPAKGNLGLARTSTFQAHSMPVSIDESPGKRRHKVFNLIGVTVCNSIPRETHHGPARVRPSLPWSP